MVLRVLNTLTDSAYQSVSFVTGDNENVKLTLRFIPSQETWYLDVESDSLTTRGLALTSFEDVLDPYKNNITWSLWVWSADGFDPWRADDFTRGRIKLAIAEGLERSVIEEYLDVASAS